MKMKKFILTSFVAIGLGISISANNLPSWFVKDNTNINNIIKKSNNTHKIIMLFFDLHGCPYCMKMINVNLRRGKLAKLTRENFIVVHINSEGSRIVHYKNFNGTEKEFKQKLKLIFSPTMVFLNKSGDIIAKFPGYRNPKKYKSILNYIISKSYKKFTYEEYLSEIKFEEKW